MSVGDGVLRQPRAWRHLYNPFRPSWGEPYAEVADRMHRGGRCRARARPAGHEAVLVSHQLPVWIARLAAEDRRLWHDPRSRQCTLASLTSLTYDGDTLSGHHLHRAVARPARQGKQGRRSLTATMRPVASARHRPPRCSSGQRSSLSAGADPRRHRPRGRTAGSSPATARLVLVPEAERAPRPGPRRADPRRRARSDLRDHLGEVVVLNVWASWCAPCRAEAPALAALADGVRQALACSSSDSTPATPTSRRGPSSSDSASRTRTSSTATAACSCCSATPCRRRRSRRRS